MVYKSATAASLILRSSRNFSAAVAAKWPPALPPTSAIRRGSTPKLAACFYPPQITAARQNLLQRCEPILPPPSHPPPAHVNRFDMPCLWSLAYKPNEHFESFFIPMGNANSILLRSKRLYARYRNRVSQRFGSPKQFRKVSMCL